MGLPPNFNASGAQTNIALPNWDEIRSMKRSGLLGLGMGNWDGKLFLFPASWFDHIPEGFEVKTINGATEKFSKATSSRDARWGMLAYGIEVA
jgi:hypothetical protein